MIVIDFDSEPGKSIYYTSALLFEYLNSKCLDFEEVYKYFKRNIMDSDLMFYYSMDWLFLIGKIKGIQEGKIICG